MQQSMRSAAPQRTLAGKSACPRPTVVRPRVATAALVKHDVPLELEKGALPLNTYGNKAPYKAKIKSVKKITGPKSTGEVYHVVIDHEGKVPFWEGQSYGIIPPGTKINNKGKEVPHSTRLYSIASSRYGDEFNGKTTTLCVRRATFVDPATGKEDPAKKGICSNFLADAQPGQEVSVVGPTGKVLLLPEDTKAPLIMVATGTGIAPFRSFWRRIFFENTPNYKFEGLFWLFMGAANSDGKLYDDELKEIAASNKNFRLDYAMSREQKNKKGGKLYIQDKIEEYADEIFDLLSNGGAHMYFCGLKGMMPGINEMLERVCKEKGLDFGEFAEKLKKEGRWHVEVY